MDTFPHRCADPPASGFVMRLRDSLARAGFTESAAARLFELVELPTLRRLRQMHRHSHQIGDDSPLATLVKLFILGETVSQETARESLHPLVVEDGIRCGLLSGEAAGVRAAVQISPFQDLQIASDWPDRSDLGIEPVMGVAASSRAMAQLMIPRRVEQALDLGCGSGVLALRAAQHSGRVWAVDLNPRAVAMTRFNAALNDIANIECRGGDLFEPVRDQTFDLIVCNPPFVIAPTAGRLHSQIGRLADDLCRSIVRSAPQFLCPNGFFQLVGNWVSPAGGDWRSRLADWCDGLGCEAWVLHARSEDAATYARNRIAEATDDPEAAAKQFDDWTAYYRREGIEAIEFGVITLRRTADGQCSFRCDAIPANAGFGGADIEREFAERDSPKVASATSYDEFPYDDHIFGFTQPANLAAVATLYGLTPPPLDNCRVLDLGCAAGVNLLPMAMTRPQSGFVGLDLSPRQIAAGRETVSRLGLTNVALHTRSILDSDDDLGMFDYIICHGVYSWVPPAVQEGILDLIRRHLTPTGIAYVSYNTYPGWHMRGVIRGALAFHAAGVVGSPAQKTAHARAFLEFLVDALPEQDTAYATIFRRDAEMVRPTPDSYVFHEFLEADNRPVYFHEFAASAAAHGLQFLAEASPLPLPGNLKPGVLQSLAAAAGDRIRLEQYLDFLRCRIFRRSLLCHAALQPDYNDIVKRIPSYSFSSKAKPEAKVPVSNPDQRETFELPNKSQFVTADLTLRAALWRLWQARPDTVPFAELLDAVQPVARESTGAKCVDKAADLADGLLQMYIADVIKLHLYPPALATTPGPRPCASPFARLQAERGDRKIFNHYHSGIEPGPFARYLLPLLDGTRTSPELVEILFARAAAGEFAVHDNDGQPVVGAELIRSVLTAWVDTALTQLANAALLSKNDSA